MTLLLIAIGATAAGAVVPFLIRRGTHGERLAAMLVAGGGVLASVAAVRLFTHATDSATWRWASALPGGDWVIGMDALSAAFVLIVAVVGAANAVFGHAYMRDGGNTRVGRHVAAAYAMLVTSLLLVVTAQSTVLFLCAWEAMAISSFLLIVSDHHHAHARSAGLVYLIATHTATLLLFVMFALWSRDAADWSFASLEAAGSAVRTPVLLLALAAFGVKAGFVPLHFWLPAAHAAAPSHVSALMSGVVIKTGIYGLLRVAMLVGPTPEWWGWTMLTLGAASALLGVLWALAQHDIKRLLAYHSVENIGIILLGIGLGGLGAAYGLPALELLGYGGAVLHSLNHALFKSLLFMAAGTLYGQTGSRNIEDHGGAARRMPVTFVMFLVGSVAIIGVPPLNGFASEWLVFRGLLSAIDGNGVTRTAYFAAPLLALVGGLALACFAKVTGAMFLGKPRTDHVPSREASAVHLAPQIVLALCCVTVGVVPVWTLPLLAAVTSDMARRSVDGAALAAVTESAMQVAWYAALLIGVTAVTLLVRHALLRRRAVRTAPTWGCAYDAPTPRMQYTASSFAAPLLAVFGPLAGVREHRGATVFHSEPRDLVLDGILSRGWALLQAIALRVRPLQHGRLNLYLMYVVAAVIVCLGYLVAAP